MHSKETAQQLSHKEPLQLAFHVLLHEPSQAIFVNSHDLRNVDHATATIENVVFQRFCH